MHEISITSSLAGRITGFFVLQSRLGEFSIIARPLTLLFSVRANMVVTCGQGWNCGPVVIIAITEKKVTVHSAINYFVKKKRIMSLASRAREKFNFGPFGSLHGLTKMKLCFFSTGVCATSWFPHTGWWTSTQWKATTLDWLVLQRHNKLAWTLVS